MSAAKPIAVPVPAATILIVRKAVDGMEVFMVKRHHQIDFVAGALVFPGGKATKSDFDPALGDFCDGMAAFSAQMHGVAVAAIREAFEESGILFARESGADGLIGAARLETLSHYRQKLEKGELSMLDMLRAENLRLAGDGLAHFAHWVTPKMMTKRFDTHFFVAAAPEGHVGAHDGRESVDSTWIKPEDAIADRKRWNVIFPTKLNLMKLAQSKTPKEAIATAKKAPPLTVEPWTETGPDGQVIKIRDDAGYEQTSAKMRDAF